MEESVWGQLKTREVDGIPGLVLAIAQDAQTSEVLMAAFADREAVEKTVETGLAHYYSTSRKKIWLKGESSGHTQKVSEILVDCDGDALIYKIGGAQPACHKGYGTCFYRRIEGGGLKVFKGKAFDPEKVY